MFPSSSRVKLNRVALKDVVGLRLVPRRRRVPAPLNNVTTDSNKRDVSEIVSVKDTSSNDPVQTFLTEQTAPHKVSDTAGRDHGGKCAAGTYTRTDTEFKPEGPLTGGKYHQVKPNTRSKSRLERLRFTWCFCADSELLVKQAEVPRRVKPRCKIPKMSCKMQLSSEVPLAVSNATDKQPKPKYAAGKLRRGSIGTGVTLVAKSLRDRGTEGRGQGRVKTRSAGCDPLRTGTRSTPTGLSSKAHLAYRLLMLG